MRRPKIHLPPLSGNVREKLTTFGKPDKPGKSVHRREYWPAIDADLRAPNAAKHSWSHRRPSRFPPGQFRAAESHERTAPSQPDQRNEAEEMESNLRI
jgi:hypothetical protein